MNIQVVQVHVHVQVQVHGQAASPKSVIIRIFTHDVKLSFLRKQE